MSPDTAIAHMRNSAHSSALGSVVLTVVSLFAAVSFGDELAVPVNLQAELMSKLAKFDRNFAARAGDKALVLIAYKKGALDSERVAKQLKAAFEAQALVGGVAHEEVLVLYTTPAALLADAKRLKAPLIFLSSGIPTEARAIADTFAGYDGVTVSTSAEGVEQGVVIGFELVSGKPKMLLNLTQARRQNADFRFEVLKLMKVFP